MSRGIRQNNLRTAIVNAHMALGELMRALEEERDAEPPSEVTVNGLLTLKEAADLLRISTATLRKRFKDGKAPFLFRDGPKTLRARREGISKWLQE